MKRRPSESGFASVSAFGARLGSPLFLLVLLALWLLATQGVRPLLQPDEGRYASVAREMLAGDAWLPTLNGLPFFHKPPLFYWIDMAAMKVFGVNAFASRMGSMIGAWLMGASLLLALRRWSSAGIAATALGVLATTPFFFVGAQYANHDMLVAGLITAAIFALVRALEVPHRLDLGWLVVGAVGCALAVLAKGLIGCVLPALVLGPWLLAQRRWRDIFRLLHPVGLLAFLIVVAPWMIVMQLRFADFFDYFFVQQHFRRFLHTSFNNVNPFWFYLAVLPVLTLPWSLWLPAAVRRVWSQRDTYTGLYVWWLIAVVGFFSFPSSKLVGYALPALAPFCVLLALAVGNATQRRRHWVLAGAAVFCAAIVVAVAWEAPKSNRAAALALASHRADADRVVMVDDYFYDLPFYARLTQPVIVVSDWSDPELTGRDSWRKELLDAARFDPVRGRELLRPLADMDALTCGAAAVWFVVRPAMAHRVADLTGTVRVYADHSAELWRAAARSCP